MSETVQYPQYSSDGVPLTYVPNPFAADGKPADDQWKLPVRVHTTGTITLSGLQTVDGVALMEGDRVLVKEQVLPEQNGIYMASAFAWRRALDCYLWEQFPAAVVAVQEGLSVGDTVFICDAAGTGTVGVTPNYWVSVAAVSGTIPTFTPLRALVSDPVGAPSASPTTSQEIAFLSGVTSPVQSQIASVGNQAASAFTIAVTGTNAAASAQSTANTAQSTAGAAYSIAVLGTNAAATSQSTANAAYTLAQAGTNIGSLAYTVATGLGDKYVRTTRFASIGAGTSGAVALPANSIVVLDDFGGGVDAVVTTIVAGRPTFAHAVTLAGDIVTTSFDAGGNYSLSGTPSVYPVAVVYRVRQKLSEYDSTSADIIGSYDIEDLPPFLTQLRDVNVPSPQAQQVLLYNGSVWIAGDAAAVTAPGAFNFYLEGTNSGTNSYRTLATEPSGGVESADAASVGGSPSLVPVQSFVTSTADRDHINPGVWRFITYASVAVQNRTAYSITEMWVRGINGSESLLFAGTSEPINSATPTLYMTVVSRGSYSIAPTDKLVAKYYFLRTASPVTSATLYYSGTEHISLISTPIILEHNDLDGIQGGVTSERYHLTSAQSAALSSTVHAPTAANPLVTAADIPFNVFAISSGTTLVLGTPNTHRVYLADTSLGDVIVALPNATGWQGNIVHIKKTGNDANYVHVRSATGTATVDNILEQVFNAPQMSLQITAYLNNWYII